MKWVRDYVKTLIIEDVCGDLVCRAGDRRWISSNASWEKNLLSIRTNLQSYCTLWNLCFLHNRSTEYGSDQVHTCAEERRSVSGHHKCPQSHHGCTWRRGELGAVWMKKGMREGRDRQGEEMDDWREGGFTRYMQDRWLEVWLRRSNVSVWAQCMAACVPEPWVQRQTQTQVVLLC